jgi:hypothetical protein
MPSLDQLVEMISNGNTEGANSANSEAAGSATGSATAGATTCAANDHACTAAAGKKQSASVLSEQAESALFYLAKNIRSLYEGKHIPGHAKFLPTNQGMRTIKVLYSVYSILNTLTKGMRTIKVLCSVSSRYSVYSIPTKACPIHTTHHPPHQSRTVSPRIIRWASP